MARRCKYTQCRKELPPARQCTDYMQKKGFCNVECATQCGIERAQRAAEKKKSKETRKAKERLKTRSDYARDAQRDFNSYIRERDRDLPCISCGRMPNFSSHVGGSGVQAGHYRSVGACPELRFEELNVHVQCYRCNVYESGNAIDYRIGLIKKIGQEAVDWIEGPHEPKKYTVDELKEIAKHYRQKTREMKRNN